MSRIEQLLKEFCPNDVSYIKVQDIAEISTGSSNGNEATDDGLYPFYIRSATVKKLNTYEFDEEAIIIPGEGGIGDIYHYVNGKYALHQRVYRIHIIRQDVNAKYVYYCFTNYFKSFILKKAVNATVMSIRKPMIAEFQIPLPALPVQREIVRVLDGFTLYSQELTAELTARCKQYEYYRDKLLTFEKPQVEWRTLNDVFYQYNGMTGVSKKWAEDGNCKFIDYMNAYKNSKIDVTKLQNATVSNLKQNTIRKGDILFTSASETPDECAICAEVEDDIIDDIFLDDHLFALRPKQNDLFFKGYLKYAFSTNAFRKTIHKAVRGVTRFYISQKDFMKLRFPIPSLEVQKRIVNVLDNFDKICSDLKIGLPAEIEKRQAQYEFYRDKLLTFDNESATILYRQTDRQTDRAN
ncbi:MAG: restriction endonuclease subunit S [Christensenellaceae bacterium]